MNTAISLIKNGEGVSNVLGMIGLMLPESTAKARIVSVISNITKRPVYKAEVKKEAFIKKDIITVDFDTKTYSYISESVNSDGQTLLSHVITIPVPGFTKSDLSAEVTVNDDGSSVLKISPQLKEPMPNALVIDSNVITRGENHKHVEYFPTYPIQVNGFTEGYIRVPARIDIKKVSLKVENGVLMVWLLEKEVDDTIKHVRVDIS